MNRISDRPVLTLTAEGNMTDTLGISNLSRGPVLSPNNVVAVSVFLDEGEPGAVIDFEGMIPNTVEQGRERWGIIRRFTLSEQGKGEVWVSPSLASCLHVRFRAVKLGGVEPVVTCQLGM